MNVDLVGHGTPRSMLEAIRWTLDEADQAILCSAFVRRAGVHLVEAQLRELGSEARVVATSVFGGSSSFLAMAAISDTGARVRIANPGRGTFHPKLYVARSADRVRTLVGSANLTGGLVTNVEVAAALEGHVDDPVLATSWATAESYWHLTEARAWMPIAAEESGERFSTELLGLLQDAVRRDPNFLTLAQGQLNRVVDVTRTGLWVETESSRAKGRPPQEVPSWMFELAWEYLTTNGRLSNQFLLAGDGLNVKRSSAVAAILARLPHVRVASRQPIELAYDGPA